MRQITREGTGFPPEPKDGLPSDRKKSSRREIRNDPPTFSKTPRLPTARDKAKLLEQYQALGLVNPSLVSTEETLKQMQAAIMGSTVGMVSMREAIEKLRTFQPPPVVNPTFQSSSVYGSFEYDEPDPWPGVSETTISPDEAVEAIFTHIKTVSNDPETIRTEASAWLTRFTSGIAAIINQLEEN